MWHDFSVRPPRPGELPTTFSWLQCAPEDDGACTTEVQNDDGSWVTVNGEKKKKKKKKKKNWGSYNSASSPNYYYFFFFCFCYLLSSLQCIN